jgi:hypothetical protein
MEGATERATSGALNVDTTNLPSEISFVYIAFTTPYTCSGTPSLNIRVSASASSRVWWIRNSTASNWMRAVVDDSSSSKPASGDTIILGNGTTLTVDESITMAASNIVSCVIGEAAIFTVPDNASAITVDFGAGYCHFGSSGSFLVGSSGTPWRTISNAPGVTITGSLTPLRSTNYYTWFTAATVSRFDFKIYGTKYSKIYLTTDVDIATAQPTLSFTEDIPATWEDGDLVAIAGKDVQADSSVYYIRKTAARTVDLYNSAINAQGAPSTTGRTNLNFQVFAGARLINYTATYRNTGVYWTNNYFMSNGQHLNGMVLSGIVGSTSNSFATFTPASREDTVVDSILQWGPYGSMGDHIAITGVASPKKTITNYHIVNAAAGYSTLSRSVSLATISNSTWRNTAGDGGSLAVNLSGNSNTWTNCYFSGYSSTSGQYCSISAIGTSFINCRFNAGILLSSTGSVIFRDCVQYGARAYGLYVANASLNSFINCTIGKGSTNVTKDIYHASEGYNELYFDGCNIGTKGVDDNFVNTAAGSYMQWHNYNGTVGDHRTWKSNGTFVTDSAAYTNLRQTTGSTTRTLGHDFLLLSQTIADKAITLVGTCQIANAAYYAGAHTDPTIKIYTDGNITTPKETLVFSTSSTDEQTSSVTFTPTTSNSLVYFVVETQTEATGTDAAVLWSDFKIVKRIYGSVFTEQSLNISETLTYPIATINSPYANAFITEADVAVVDDYTGIAVNASTETITITEAHTIEELYDYLQYWLTQNLLVSEFFSTIDGTNFTCLYDIVVDGVTLDSAGKVINMPTKELTLDDGGSVTGKVVDINGTIASLTLTGLQTGTEVHIYADSDDEELAVTEGTAGSTFTYNYTWTEDVGIYVTILKAGYQWIRYEDLELLSDNQSIPVFQIIDRNYNNPA